MTKAILKLEIHDDEKNTKAMTTVFGFSGVDSISMDMKDKKLTVIGDIDPANIVNKLKEGKEPEKMTDEGKELVKMEYGKYIEDDVFELFKAMPFKVGSYNPGAITEPSRPEIADDATIASPCVCTCSCVIL